jgi:type IV pilus assembly protein PilM
VPARSAIGLDIGTSGVRAAQLSFGKGRVTLEKFGQVALPEGAVRDGEVVDRDAVADAIKQLWAHTKFSSKKVNIGVANQKVVVRQVELPWMPADELRKSLPFQVQDFVPMPIDQALLDFHALEEYTDDTGGRTIRGLLVAASRDMVLASVDAVRAGGLAPKVVDLTSFAVLRSMGAVDHVGLGSGGVEALVDVGARVTNIILHQGGVPRFVRILLMGGQDITDAVAERMGVPHAQAEAMKQQLGLGAAAGGPEAQAAVRVVEMSGSAFVDEVRGSLDYYMASSGSGSLERLVLTGGGARLSGLAERLAAVTRVPVELGTPMRSLEIGKTGLTPEQLEFVAPLAAVPVGLALGDAS